MSCNKPEQKKGVDYIIWATGADHQVRFCGNHAEMGRLCPPDSSYKFGGYGGIGTSFDSRSQMGKLCRRERMI